MWKGARSTLATATTACLLASMPAVAGQQTFSAEFQISYLGFPVARSTMQSRISDSDFHMQGTIRSAGLGAFFDSTNATTSVGGRFEAGVTRPSNYAVSYTYGKKSKATALGFNKGSLDKVSNDPPLPPRGPEWIGVSQEHLRGVIDPLSATLVRASNKSKVCGRTVSIFDGEIRADVVLTPSQSAPVSLPGIAKGAVSCNARLVPVAGYNPSNRSLRYLRDKSRINITFAQLGTTSVFAPIYATVGTRYGTVTIAARRFSEGE